jgi:hypothetical protein
MLKNYNYIIDGILIEVLATDVEQGRKLAQATLEEMKQILPKN